MKILLIGDDPPSMCSLERELAEHGHEVLLATGNLDVLDVLRGGVDACVLDFRQPAREGRRIVDKVRGAGIETPMLCLAANDSHAPRTEQDDAARRFEVQGFLSRLESRVREEEQRTRLGELELDLGSRTARIGARELPLSEKQFALLAFFVRHAGETMTRPAILKTVFGYDFDTGTNIVDVHVAHLRSKLSSAETLRITTVRGQGYRLEGV